MKNIPKNIMGNNSGLIVNQDYCHKITNMINKNNNNNNLRIKHQKQQLYKLNELTRTIKKQKFIKKVLNKEIKINNNNNIQFSNKFDILKNKNNEQYDYDNTVIIFENKYNTKKIKKKETINLDIILENYLLSFKNIKKKENKPICKKINMKDIIKKKQDEEFEKFINYMKAFTLFKKINKKINEVIDNYSDNIYNTTINTKDVIYMTIEMESLNETQISFTKL